MLDLQPSTDIIQYIDNHIALAHELIDQDLPKAITVIREIQKLSAEIEYPKGVAHALLLLSQYQKLQLDYPNALHNALQSYDLFCQLDDLTNQAASARIIGQVHGYFANYGEALQWIIKALEYFQKLGNADEESRTLTNLGIIYTQTHDYEQALQMFQRSLEIDKQQQNLRNQALALNNIAMAHYYKREFEVALTYAQAGLAMILPLNMKRQEAILLDTIGGIYIELQAFTKASQYLQKGLKIARQHEFAVSELHLLLNLSQIHLKKGKTAQALDLIMQAIPLAERSHAKEELSQCYRDLSKCYEALGNFEQSLLYYKKYHLFTHEMFNEESEQRFKTLEVAYRTQVAQKEMELYREKTAVLQHEISERNRIAEQLAEAKEKAEVANRAKSAFLANMSHELRTPLNAILGFAQLMSQDHALPMTSRENMRLIQRSGEHLLELINDILDMSKIEAGRATLIEKDFNLFSLLQNIEEMMQLRAQKKELGFHIDIGTQVPQHIFADERKLRQVLINLLSNAFKFTDEGEVNLRVRRETNNLLYFAVEDTGMGISAGEMDRLFEAFVQTESGELKEGTGLGLSISQEFVHLMGGKMSVKSELSKGSTFSFTIEFAEGIAELAQIQPFKQKVVGLVEGQPNYTILIVEDTEENRILLRQLLEPVGFTVEEAVNGKEAIQQFRALQPDLVWMDMRMPVMDGYEATRQIKAIKQDTPVIALTASVLEQDLAGVQDVGCDAVLRKPFQTEDIFEMMHRFLPLEYVYADMIDPLPQPRPLKREVEPVALPEAWVQDLTEATKLLDTRLMLSLVSSIDKSNPPLATTLKTWIHDFEYDRVLNFLEKASS